MKLFFDMFCTWSVRHCSDIQGSAVELWFTACYSGCLKTKESVIHKVNVNADFMWHHVYIKTLFMLSTKNAHMLTRQSCGVQQSRKRRCLEQGVMFDDDGEERVRADRGAQNWTVELNSQAKAESNLPAAICCVSIWNPFSLWALVQCIP